MKVAAPIDTAKEIPKLAEAGCSELYISMSVFHEHLAGRGMRRIDVFGG